MIQCCRSTFRSVSTSKPDSIPMMTYKQASYGLIESTHRFQCQTLISIRKALTLAFDWPTSHHQRQDSLDEGANGRLWSRKRRQMEGRTCVGLAGDTESPRFLSCFCYWSWLVLCGPIWSTFSVSPPPPLYCLFVTPKRPRHFPFLSDDRLSFATQTRMTNIQSSFLVLLENHGGPSFTNLY